jgi:hypothetical protein
MNSTIENDSVGVLTVGQTMEIVATGIREYVADRVGPLDLQVSRMGQLLARIERLEDQLSALEQKTIADAFTGKWIDGRRYSRGQLTQKSGLWLALKSTSARPGSDPASWRLLVKQLHDGDE